MKENRSNTTTKSNIKAKNNADVKSNPKSKGDANAKSNPKAKVKKAGTKKEEAAKKRTDTKATAKKKEKEALERKPLINKDLRNNLIKLAIIILVSLVLGVLVELIWNAHSLFDHYEKQLSFDDATIKGMTEYNGNYIVGEQGGSIRYELDGSYVKKFEYAFDTKSKGVFVQAMVKVGYIDGYGNLTEKIISDRNPYISRRSIININKNAEYIEIVFGGELAGMEVGGTKISNNLAMIKERILFFAVVFFIIGMLYFFRNAWMDKPENIFLVMALTMGTLFVVLNPFVKVGWDEDVHFQRAYTLPVTPTVKTNLGIDLYCSGQAISWPYNIYQSKEEKEELASELSKCADYRNDAVEKSRYESTKENSGNIYNIGYLTQTIGIRFGQLLNLDFVYVYMLGRWFNMLTYVLLMYVAVRILKYGKRLLSIIGLMPTPMFIAANYAYDPFVTGCISIALAIIINEMIDKDSKMKVKNMILFVLFMCLGCMPKAVYIPFILLALFLKKDKFKNKKQSVIFKSTVLVGFFAMMSTFVLPSLLNTGTNMGDARGGNTNVAEQLGLILTHPLAYIELWGRKVGSTFQDFVFGESVFGLLGHLNATPVVPVIILLIVFVIFTDNVDIDDRRFDVKQKVTISILITMVIGLIWTALYLSFTEVGSNNIVGVQGRYYIPFLILLYAMFIPKKIKNTMNPIVYNRIIYSLSAAILFVTMYSRFLKPFCM